VRAVQWDEEGDGQVRVCHVIHGERLVVGEVIDLPAVEGNVRHVCGRHLLIISTNYLLYFVMDGLEAKSIMADIPIYLFKVRSETVRDNVGNCYLSKLSLDPNETFLLLTREQMGDVLETSFFPNCICISY